MLKRTKPRQDKSHIFPPRYGFFSDVHHRSLSFIFYQATMAKDQEYWRCCFQKFIKKIVSSQWKCSLLTEKENSQTKHYAI